MRINLHAVLDELLDDLADRVAARLRGDRLWISQKGSPLGRNRHCAVVRRRISEGLDGASIVGKDYKLTEAALQEEMHTHLIPMPRSTKSLTPEEQEVADFRADLERKLEQVRNAPRPEKRKRKR